MGDKIAVINEKKYTFDGLFDIKETYNYLKNFLENSKYYDVSEKDYEEKNEGKSKKISSKNEAVRVLNDKYKIHLKYDLEMSGNNIEVNINENKTIILCKGKAKLIVNVYLEPDWDSHHHGPAIIEFLNKLYNKFYEKDEQNLAEQAAGNDVGELINRFKQQMNSEIK